MVEQNLNGIGIVGYYEEKEMETLFPIFRQLEQSLSNISLPNYLKGLTGLIFAAYCLPSSAYEHQEPEAATFKEGIMTLPTIVDPLQFQVNVSALSIQHA